MSIRLASPRMAMILGLGLVLPIASLAQQPSSASATALNEARTNLNQLRSDLNTMRTELLQVRDFGLRSRLEAALNRAQSRVQDVERTLGRISLPSAPMPISAAELEPILTALKKESFDKGRLPIVEGLGRRFYTSGQVREILKTFTFDELRVKAAVSLHSHLVDPGNFFQALEAFTFDRYKDEVRALIKNR